MLWQMILHSVSGAARVATAPGRIGAEAAWWGQSSAPMHHIAARDASRRAYFSTETA